MKAPGKSLLSIFAVLLVSFAFGCESQQTKDLTRFHSANIRSVLIIPPVNNSVEVTAPECFLSTIPVPVAEQGYYVFPVHMVKRLLEDNGMSDTAMVHNSDPHKLGELFGADAILYVTIERWEARYIGIQTSIVVYLRYELKECKTGQSVWKTRQKAVYSSGNANSGNPAADIVAQTIMASLMRANPNYVQVAKQANGLAFKYPGPGIPAGPYGEKTKQ